MCTRQPRKEMWDMINALFLTTVAVEPTFVAFHQHSPTYVRGLLCHSFKFLWRTGQTKPPTKQYVSLISYPGADLGGGCRGCSPPPLPPAMTCGCLIHLVFCKKENMWFIGVEVEQRHPLLKKNPGSAPAIPGFPHHASYVMIYFPNACQRDKFRLDT